MLFWERGMVLRGRRGSSEDATQPAWNKASCLLDNHDIYSVNLALDFQIILACL